MLNVAGFVENSIVDGPGIRFVVFCQGCPHHCPGCQNPDTWAFGTGQDFSAENILHFVQRDPLVRGVTLSGGEPFAQAAACARLAALLRENGYEVACYTGYTFEQLLNGTEDQKQLLRNLDILVDGPFLEAQRSLELSFRGSANQRILNVPASLAAGRALWEQAPRWIRDEVHPNDEIPADL